MASLIVAVLLGLGLGLSLAAPPGPMNALIARESSRHGAWAGIRVGMGAPVADVIYLAVLLFGLGDLLDRPVVIRSAAALGALLMAYFAIQTWNGRAGAKASDQPATFVAGLAAALTNPYQVAWWLSGGFVFLQVQGLPGVGGLVAGIFGWVVVFSFLMAHGASRWKWFAPVVAMVSAALLAVFSGLLALVALGLIQV